MREPATELDIVRRDDDPQDLGDRRTRDAADRRNS